jgi:hypothetical protein
MVGTIAQTGIKYRWKKVRVRIIRLPNRRKKRSVGMRKKSNAFDQIEIFTRVALIKSKRKRGHQRYLDATSIAPPPAAPFLDLLVVADDVFPVGHCLLCLVTFFYICAHTHKMINYISHHPRAHTHTERERERELKQ